MPCAEQGQLQCCIFLAFYSLHITPRLINQSLTVFANTTGSVIISLHSHTSWIAAFWTDQHHIRDINWCLELDATRINITPSLSLYLLLMLGANVHTLHNHAAVFQ